MNRLLPSSRLLPATILAIVAVLGTRSAALLLDEPAGPASIETGLNLALVGQARAAGAGGEPVPAAPATAAKTAVISRVSAPAAAPKPAPEVAAVATGFVSSPAATSASGPASAPAPAPPPSPTMATGMATGMAPTMAPAGVGAPAQADAQAAGSVEPAQVRLHLSPADLRDRQLAEREAVLAAADKRLGERVAELVALQSRLQSLQRGLKDHDEANWGGLVKLYEGMRPREAAGIFNSLEKPVLLELLDRMKPAKAGPVIASMDPEKARQMTAELAAKRTRSTTVTN